MKYIMCSVRDHKTEVFGRPFFAQSVGAAIRSFDDEVNRKDDENILYRHAKDFSLYQLGEFEDSDGSVVTIMPKILVQGDQCQRIKEAEFRQSQKISKV